jgi:hypothetical protein
MPRKVRSAVVLFLFLILAAGAVQARTWSPWEPAGLLEDVWLRFAVRVAAFWEKAGSMMDPNGAKAGAEMDPNGKPSKAVTPPTGEAGGMMDPDG